MTAEMIPDEEGTGIFAHAECDECPGGWRGRNRVYWGVAKRDAENHNQIFHPGKEGQHE